MARIMYALLRPDHDRGSDYDWISAERREIDIAEVGRLSRDLNGRTQRATLGDGSVLYLELGPVGHGTPTVRVTAIHHIWVTSMPESP